MANLYDLIYDWISVSDLDDAIKIEEQGYPTDEAATLEAFRYRQSQASNLFLGAYCLTSAPSPRELIAYVCSTLSPSESLTHESMSTHVPSSPSVCIHSVCVSPAYRRKGVGLKLLQEYISRLETAHKDKSAPYEQVLLITHEDLRPFYEKAGFHWEGKSDIVHGSRPWFQMRKVLGASSSPPVSVQPIATSRPSQLYSQDQQLPPGLWAALQQPSRNRLIPLQLSSFIGGIGDVTTPDSDQHGVLVNKFDLLCPRSDCGSIILRQGVAKFVERASVQMEPVDHPAHPLLASLPTPAATCPWWLITPSPMAFENIGFTHPAQSLSRSASGKKLKLLACAECDLGPLGWCEEGGAEFWLACSRVGYRE